MKLIYDRKQSDVDYAKSHKTETAWNKGKYTEEDLNRVESAVKKINKKLNELNYSITLTTKTDWNNSDFVNATQIKRYLENISKLKELWNENINIDVPVTLNGMTYKTANDIEELLQTINDSVLATEDYFVHMGVSDMGQNRMWQNRFRRVNQLIKWNELTYVLWSDIPSTLTWKGIDIE